jgi:hypothetical protein
MEDALNFIKSSHGDFNSLKALHFAIKYKEDGFESGNDFPQFVRVISLKSTDLVNKKASLGCWIGE